MKNVRFNTRRGYYEARLAVPAELRPTIGKPEFRENLGADKKQAARKALGILNGWHARLDDAREKLQASRPTPATAAKAHYRAELEYDDLERATPGHRDIAGWKTFSRSVYANRLRLLVAGHVERDEAEALIGYAADDLIAKDLATR